MEKEEKRRLNDTYRIVGRLGEGGGGIVYKAYHERLKIYVVAKMVRDEVKGKISNEAEANVLKRLKHRYLPRIYDFIQVDGQTYTIMDFIPGESLRERLDRQARFPQKQVLKWAIQLAEALDYLHSQKPPIIHSDIKPGNIMLTPTGNICLIDFNISLAMDRRKTKYTFLSEGYAPPEQYHDIMSYQSHIAKHMSSKRPSGVREGANGRSQIIATQTLRSVIGRGIDERSDIYSLGATLYRLLTGVRPDLNFDRIIPISNFHIGLSEGFASIIERMMSLDPSNRYRNGGELLYALNHVYELDSDYQLYRRNRRIGTCLIVGMYIVGGLLIGAGCLQIQRETVANYNSSVSLAGELLESGEYDQASEAIDYAISLIPTRIDAYVKEMQRLYSLGEYTEAARYGTEVINHSTCRIETAEDRLLLGDLCYLIGNAYFEQEDYRTSIDYFETAIQLNRKSSLYFRDYAIALAKTGSIDKAEEALAAAIELDLGEDSIYMVQGEISFTKGEYEDAITNLTLTTRTTTDADLLRRAVILCAQSYEKLGDEGVSREISFLEEARGLFSETISMHITELLADAYARKANRKDGESQVYYEKALQTFTDLYERGYSTIQMMENIAILYQEMDEFDQAEAMLLQMTEKYPDDYRGYKRLAFLEADRQQKRENRDRNYDAMQEYYDCAKNLYEQADDEDSEMLMLENMIYDLQKGGWL